MSYTHITYVLDRSGSMTTVQHDVRSGLQGYIEEQKNQEGKCTFSLILFDDQYEKIVWFRDIQKMKPLEFIPRGYTALLDAVGKAINETGAELRKMDEQERPDRVFMVIHTDGEENASKEFTKKQIADMIKHQEEKYNWKIAFIGTNIDVVKEGGSIGINKGSTRSYANTSRGIGDVYTTLNCATNNLRSATDSSFATMDCFFDDKTSDGSNIKIDPDNITVQVGNGLIINSNTLSKVP